MGGWGSSSVDPRSNRPPGLGLTTSPGGHSLQALGLTARRKEEAEVWERMDRFFSLDEKSAKPSTRGRYLEADIWAAMRITKKIASRAR